MWRLECHSVTVCSFSIHECHTHGVSLSDSMLLSMHECHKKEKDIGECRERRRKKGMSGGQGILPLGSLPVPAADQLK